MTMSSTRFSAVLLLLGALLAAGAGCRLVTSIDHDRVIGIGGAGGGNQGGGGSNQGGGGSSQGGGGSSQGGGGSNQGGGG